MNRTQKLTVALASGVASQLIGLGVSLFLAPFVLHKLGQEMTGVYQFAVDFTTYFALMDLGLALSLAVRFSREQLDVKSDRFRELVSTVALAQFCIAIAVVGLGATAAQWVPALMKVPAEHAAQTVQAFQLIAFAQGIQQATRTSASILVGYQQIHFDNIAKLIGSLVQAGLLALFLSMDWGIMAVGGAYVGGFTVSAAINAFRAAMVTKGPKYSLKAVSWSALMEIAPQGLWNSVASIGTILIASVSRPVTAQVVSLGMVAVFAFSQKFFKVAEGLIQQLSQNAAPALGELIGKNDPPALRKAFIEVLRLSTLSAGAVGAALIALNQSFVSAWVGPSQYAGLAADMLFALALLVFSWIHPFRMLLVNAQKAKEMTLPILLEGLLVVALTVMLGWWLGLPGIALAAPASCILLRVWVFPRIAQDVLGGLSAITEGSRGTLIALAPMILVAVLVREGAAWLLPLAESFLPARAAGFTIALLAGALAFSACLAIAWPLGLNALKPRLKALIRR